MRARSEAVKQEVPSIHAYLRRIRAALVKQGALVDRGDFYEFPQPLVLCLAAVRMAALNGRTQVGERSGKYKGEHTRACQAHPSSCAMHRSYTTLQGRAHEVRGGRGPAAHSRPTAHPRAHLDAGNPRRGSPSLAVQPNAGRGRCTRTTRSSSQSMHASCRKS